MSEQMPEEGTFEWFEFMESIFEVSIGKMEDKHLHMEFALNMICEMCKRYPGLHMGQVHKMALFGLGYEYEEDDASEVIDEAQA